MRKIKDKIDSDKDVRNTDKFVNDFDYCRFKKEEAQLVLQYAKEKHSVYVHDVEYIDKKADLLIKYLGIVPPALAAISGYLGLNETSGIGWPVVVAIIGGVATWVVAISYALWVVKPGDMPYPSSVEKLCDAMRDRKADKTLEAVLALRYEQVNSRLIILGNIKGNRLKIGYMLTAISIFLLFLSLIAGRR